MKFLRLARKPLCYASAAALISVTIPVPMARAALVDTQTVAARQEGVNARARVAAFMARSDVRHEMEKLGVSPKEAQARVASLSNEEVSRIAGKLDTMPAGQGVVGALVIVVLVLLILNLLHVI